MSLGFQEPIEYAKECNGCEPISRPVARTRGEHCALAVEFIADHFPNGSRDSKDYQCVTACVTRSSKREHYTTSQGTNRKISPLCTNLGHATEAKLLQAVLHKTCRTELVVSAQTRPTPLCRSGDLGGKNHKASSPQDALGRPRVHSVTIQYWVVYNSYETVLVRY